MSVADRLDRALSESRVQQGLGRVVSGSSVAARLSSLAREGRARLRARGRTVRSWLERSTVGQVGSAVSRQLGALADGSRVLSGLSAVERWVRSSWLYRWLTAEPEPDVVVIDLRETVTIRPFLTAIDESIGLLVTGRRTSIVQRSAERGWRRFRRSPVRYVSLFGLFALLGATAASVVRGTLSAGGVWLRLVLVLAFLAGLSVDRSWEDLRTSRPVQLLIAALEPPEPPGEHDSRDAARLGASDLPDTDQPDGRSRADDGSGTSPSADEVSDS